MSTTASDTRRTRPDTAGATLTVDRRTPPAGWRRLADLVPADRTRAARRWVTERRESPGAWSRFQSDRGGPAEVWLSPEAVELVGERFGAPDTAGHDRTPPDTTARLSTGHRRTPPDTADGWRAALAQAQAAADALRAERDVARVDAQAATSRAEEAERAVYHAHAQLDTLRAAWWRWRLLLATLGPVARLRRRWPADPPELSDLPLLSG
jgi:hypothetical protein